MVNAVSASDIRRVSFASAIGATLEWYDFFIFGSAAALVFNKLFFPAFDPVAGTIASLASFAIGFIARPVGGIVFGHYGDRIGRKAMLVLSLVMMGGVTFLIGLLPTYQSIGLGAPILLTTLRFLQGFAVGGEWGGATLMVIEHSPAKKRGFYGAWPQMGISAALILSTGVMALTSAYTTPEQFAAWGWRVPFLLSGVLVVVGIVIRRRVSESPSFQKLQRTHTAEKMPIATVLATHKKRTLQIVAAQAAENSSFFVISVYALVYLTQNLHMERPLAIRALMIASFFMLLSQPFFGALSDRIGRKKVYMGGMIFLGAFIFPFFKMLDTGSYPVIVTAMTLAMTIGLGSTLSAQPALISEQYPAAIRYSGVSVAYQLATVIWSGPTPILAALFVMWAGGYWLLAAYIILAAVISVLGIMPLREAAGVELSALEESTGREPRMERQSIAAGLSGEQAS
ncbi:MFS transporter [Caballeronia insecticola]|uniref:Integral membrane transport protein n=1 Tax=Caballeronia insecticola TaxID=758793 RepID=R4WY55_9BURK|nr:MFS transporter [Caballeronia insecticola]BAN26280.1 integral membrane transport protein [Caballeronia insecticola]